MDIMTHDFDIIRRKIIVKPTIKGINDYREFKFVLDTGASKSIVDEQVAIRLGFDLKRLTSGDRLMTVGGGISSKMLSLPKLSLFGKDCINFKVDVVKLPLQILPFAVGIIGMDFLLQFQTIKFDFDAKKIETI
jgi:predicted aspartyl protease